MQKILVSSLWRSALLALIGFVIMVAVDRLTGPKVAFSQTFQITGVIYCVVFIICFPILFIGHKMTGKPIWP